GPHGVRGGRAQQTRRSAMALAAQPSGAPPNGPAPLTLDSVRGLSHHSPKRYLGVRKSFSVPLGDELVPITSDELVQAAWAQLVELTNGWRGRNPTACTKGRFTRAVVTYPTVAPPSVR